MEIFGIQDEIRAANSEIAVMEWDFGVWESGVSVYQANLDEVSNMMDGYGLNGGWRTTEANYPNEDGVLMPFLNSQIDPHDPEADMFDPNSYSDDIPNAIIIDAHLMEIVDVVGDYRPVGDILEAVQVIDEQY